MITNMMMRITNMMSQYDDDEDDQYDTVESTRIEPFLGENRVILD